MPIECSQLLIRVADLTEARAFYVDRLGLEIIEEFPRMIAVRAGLVRFSIIGGGKKRKQDDDDPPATVMLRVPNLDEAMTDLTSRGVTFQSEVQIAPGFMRYVSILDPDTNEIFLAEYLADPLRKA